MGTRGQGREDAFELHLFFAIGEGSEVQRKKKEKAAREAQAETEKRKRKESRRSSPYTIPKKKRELTPQDHQ